MLVTWYIYGGEKKYIYRIHIYREKSETRTEILVGITDEEDIFADTDILEFDMEKELNKKHVRVWSGRIWFILDFSSILLSNVKETSLLHTRYSKLYEEKLKDSSLKTFKVIKNQYFSK